MRRRDLDLCVIESDGVLNMGFNIQCEKIEKSAKQLLRCTMCGDYFKGDELDGRGLCKRCAEYKSKLSEYYREG